MNISALEATVVYRFNLKILGKRLEEDLHMSALTGKPIKGLQSFAPMLYAKGRCWINNSSDDFRIIGKEKDRHLIRFKESIFINHFKPSLNTKEDNAELVFLRNDIMVYGVNKSSLAVFVLCV